MDRRLAASDASIRVDSSARAGRPGSFPSDDSGGPRVASTMLRTLRTTLVRFVRDERGVESVEYLTIGVILAYAVAAFAIGLISILSENLQEILASIDV